MRGLTAFVAVAVAVVCQLTIVDRIAFPGGAGPDLVLVLVAALALASGPLLGALTGFWAGLALDVAPPGSHFTGQNALVFCLIGYLCGLLAYEPSADSVAEQGHTAMFEIVVTAAGAICGEALAALLGVMLSDPRVTWPAISHVLPVAAAYNALACPFVLYAAAAALRVAGARGEGRKSPAARIAPSGLGQGAVRPVGTANVPRLRLAGGGKSEGWIGGLRGPGTGGRPAGSGSSALARTRMGRSLLGGSVFSRSSPALARTVPVGGAALPGRALTPRFSRGKGLGRLTGALHGSARPRSPGKGWLRRSPPRSGAMGRGALGASTMGRGAFKSGALKSGAFRSGAFKGGAIGGSAFKGGAIKGGAFKRGPGLGRGPVAGGGWKRGLRTGGPARLRMPRRRFVKRSWRTGGYR